MESLMAQLLAKEIVKNLETPDAIITIDKIEINDERKIAFVHLSVFPDERKPFVVMGLNKIAPKLQWFLIQKMRVKTLPNLVFQAEHRGITLEEIEEK